MPDSAWVSDTSLVRNGATFPNVFVPRRLAMSSKFIKKSPFLIIAVQIDQIWWWINYEWRRALVCLWKLEISIFDYFYFELSILFSSF